MVEDMEKNEEAAYDLFLNVNKKRLPMDSIELIKARILFNDFTKRRLIKWKKLESLLIENENKRTINKEGDYYLSRFVILWFQIYKHKFITEGELEKEFNDEIRRNNVESFLDELIELAQLLDEIRTKQTKNSPLYMTIFYKEKLFDSHSEFTKFLIIFFYIEYKINENISKDNFIEILSILEKIIINQSLNKKIPAYLIRDKVRIIVTKYRSSKVIDINEIINWFKDILNTDSFNKIGELLIKLPNFYKYKYSTFLLAKLNAINDKENDTFERIMIDKDENGNSLIEKEHIFPQSPKKEFSYTDCNFFEKEENINNIGNITLTCKSYNIEMKNSPFTKKKEIICGENGILWINRNLCQYEEWTKETFKERQEWYINKMKQCNII
jgi:hypothetical protein